MATVITNVGLAEVTLALTLSGDNKYVAWGTGAGTAAAGDTTLFTEAAEARTSGTQSQVTTTQTNDTYQVVGSITATGTRTITNAGIFDASTSGNLFIKGDFADIGVVTDDVVEFTFKLACS